MSENIDIRGHGHGLASVRGGCMGCGRPRFNVSNGASLEPEFRVSEISVSEISVSSMRIRLCASCFPDERDAEHCIPEVRHGMNVWKKLRQP